MTYFQRIIDRIFFKKHQFYRGKFDELLPFADLLVFETLNGTIAENTEFRLFACFQLSIDKGTHNGMQKAFG